MLVNSSGISGACKLTFIELDLRNHSHTEWNLSSYLMFQGGEWY